MGLRVCGEWGMGKGARGMGSGVRGLGFRLWGSAHAECPMPKAHCLRAFVASWLLLGALLAPGCVGRRAHEARLATGVHSPTTLAVSIFRGDGSSASSLDVLDACVDGDVVVIGETHGHEVGLGFAAEVFEGVLQSRPNAALSMEFYDRDQQVALDDYLLGVIDDEGFKEAARRTAGNDPAGHRRMLEAARTAGVPVVAANAPRRYVTLARTEGYERLRGLSEEQRRLFVIPWRMPDGRYREEFFGLMGGMFGDGSHGEEVPEAERSARIEAIFRSQSLWDATMASAIADAMARSRPVVHVVGRFHSDFAHVAGGGTVQLLRDLRPGARIVTLSVIDAGEEVVGALREEDRDRADFVVYARGQTEASGE